MKKNDIVKWIQNIGKKQCFLLFLCGVLCVLIAIPLDNKKNENTAELSGTEEAEEGEGEQSAQEAGQGTVSVQDEEMEAYRKLLCEELEEFLGQMDGAGEVKVYITLKTSAELVVETNTPYTSKKEEETGDGTTKSSFSVEDNSEVVFVENEDGSREPFIVKKNAPVVQGIVVCAQGAGKENVKTNIQDALEALFGLDEHKIKVVKLGTE
jgi:stage III sporulation protein AG